ncbi:MAG: PilT/PilU family type 4a pilus ATPase [Kofleriaceae bacterium]|nr:PilT/PilU family type 4a pilus ATPase [Kofleriaceae bacterium]
MSAIPSLLRVMTLRGADAIIIDAGKTPLLRRRGNLEPLTTGAIDEATLLGFLQSLTPSETVDRPTQKVTRRFAAEGGHTYEITLEPTAVGLRLMAKAVAATASTGATAPAPSTLLAHTPPISVAASAAMTSLAVHAANAASAANSVPARTEINQAAIKQQLAAVLNSALQAARLARASDVWVSSAAPPRMRVAGTMRELGDHDPIDQTALTALITALVTPHGGHYDLALGFGDQRARVNVFAHLDGVAAAIRLIADEPPTLAQLELPAELAKIAELRDGLVLFCGPTGSGKSTSLAAIVAHLDATRAAHIVTLEDPIEYRFRPRHGLIHQREIGTHCTSFASGLRAALRESPDVILLGELRDRDTIAAALTAAETGHLVVATLHAPNAAVAVDRIIDAFPESQARAVRHQLAAVLRTVVTQYLLPRRNGGRVAAVEYVPVNAAIANIIRKGELQTLPTAVASGRDAGMIALERSLARLVELGQVSSAEAKRISTDTDLMNSLLPKGR